MTNTDILAAHSRKPRGHGAERRGEILDAAKRLFLADGLRQATMRRIAAAVGVSSTALYVYFPDKEAIHQAIAEATFAELLAALEASQSAATTPIEQLRAGLHAYIAFGLERPDEYRLTFMVGGRVIPEACRSIDDADRSFAILQRGVQAMMDEGSFAPASAELVAETIWAALHGVTAMLLDHSGHLASAPSRLVAETIEMVMAGCSRRR